MQSPPKIRVGDTTPIFIAFTGNANVGKSVIFNQLTGLNQTVGNWPGKTVEWAEGNTTFKGHDFKLVDLPGIYSLSTYSLEEIVTRDYLIDKHPDFIIDVIDATSLGRNLFFTLQLLELHIAPVIVVLNQWDLARKKGLSIDVQKLAEILGCPVLPAVAVTGRGVHEILETVIDYAYISKNYCPIQLRLGKEVEEQVSKVVQNLCDLTSPYSPRFAAIKLIEGDSEIRKFYAGVNQEAVALGETGAQILEKIHGENAETIISSEFYNIVAKIVGEVQRVSHAIEKRSFVEKLDTISTHRVWGYFFLAAILLGVYISVFTLGNWIANAVNGLYLLLSNTVYSMGGADSPLIRIIWDGGVGGFMGAVGGVLPFVFIFYFFLEILQDSGYLPRAAFLMDAIMHKMGLHGKSIIPLIIGFGCNVPGCTACRILETKRERNISIYATTMVPCAAVTTVVIGLVGRYVGLQFAFLLYFINFAVIIIMGRIAFKLARGENTELIIEMHEYRKPNFNVIMKQTWFRGREFVYRALPLIVIIGIMLQLLLMFKALDPINAILAPVTVFWLGLPAGVGIFLIYGIFRKELTLILLANYVLTLGLTVPEFMSPLQMMVFALVTMLYVPCIATIIVVKKEAGWKIAAIITLAEIGVALLVGGLLNWGTLLFQSIL